MGLFCYFIDSTNLQLRDQLSRSIIACSPLVGLEVPLLAGLKSSWDEPSKIVLSKKTYVWSIWEFALIYILDLLQQPPKFAHITYSGP